MWNNEKDSRGRDPWETPKASPWAKLGRAPISAAVIIPIVLFVVIAIAVSLGEAQNEVAKDPNTTKESVETMKPSAEELLRNGTKPSLEQLQDKRIISVYNDKAEQIPLFYVVELEQPKPKLAHDGSWIHMGVGSSYELNEDAQLPEGTVYADRILSGQYLVLDDVLYVVFGEADVVDEVLPGYVYDMVITDEDGRQVNAAVEPVNTGTIPMPD